MLLEYVVLTSGEFDLDCLLAVIVAFRNCKSVGVVSRTTNYQLFFGGVSWGSRTSDEKAETVRGLRNRLFLEGQLVRLKKS